MAMLMIKHAFAMIFGNLNDALRASAIPFLVLTAVGVIGNAAFAPAVAPQDAYGPEAVPVLFFTLVHALFSLFVFGWVAVTWHRFILREEYPAIIPTMADRPIWPYIWQSFVVGLIVLLCMIPVLFVATPFLGLTAQGGILGPILIGFLIGLVFSYVWLRFAIVLPGTAVGAPMKLGEGWAATRPMSSEILNVALIFAGLNAAVSLLTAQLGGIPVFGFLLEIAAQWTLLMVGLSLLTTLYGHLVEGRDLPT